MISGSELAKRWLEDKLIQPALEPEFRARIIIWLNVYKRDVDNSLGKVG